MREYVKARQLGASLVVTLPKLLAEKASIRKGDMLFIETQGEGRVRLRKFETDAATMDRWSDRRIGGDRRGSPPRGKLLKLRRKSVPLPDSLASLLRGRPAEPGEVEESASRLAAGRKRIPESGQGEVLVGKMDLEDLYGALLVEVEEMRQVIDAAMRKLRILEAAPQTEGNEGV